MAETVRLTRSSPEVAELATVLSRAFHVDPLFQFFFPDVSKRPSQLTWFMQMVLHWSADVGEVWAASTLEGGISWIPGNLPIALAELARTRSIDQPEVGFRSLARMLTSFNMLESTRRRVVGPDHVYGLFMAVASGTRRGVADQLLNHLTGAAIRSGQQCYFETTSQLNVRYFRRRGLRVAAEGVLPAGGPQFWGMILNKDDARTEFTKQN